MSKKITIIGGGISGLATLHYLSQKYNDRKDVSIYLLEKENHLGGTIGTLKTSKGLIETGPNGFLDSKPRTLEFIQELDLTLSLIRANKESEIRYILKNDALQKVPNSPKEFLKSPILKPTQKLRVFQEFFKPKQKLKTESVYDFAERRLGQGIADWFIDPMVRGIYGGDARHINLKAAFPRMHELENTYGSLIRAMLTLKKRKEGASPSPKGHLTSFVNGMQDLINTLHEKYKKNITLSSPIKTISHTGKKYLIYTDSKAYEADEVYCSVPAYVATKLLKSLDSMIADDLNRIEYAPINVISLIYNKTAFSKVPDGFGFLVPSLEKKPFLGVLFDSNIFPNRTNDQQWLCRMMVGQNTKDKSSAPIDTIHIKNARMELEKILNITEKPIYKKTISWPKAIPQYTNEYVAVQKRIEDRLTEHKNLYLVANYWKGISFNDCIENAYQSAIKSNL